jgi:hypothetical protein
MLLRTRETLCLPYLLPQIDFVVNVYFSRALLATCFHAGFLHGLFFDPEGEGDMFLRNVG